MNIFFGAPRFRLGWILIAIAILNALVWTVVRWSYENSNTQVQITLDYDDTRTMADAYRVPLKELLRQFKGVGAASVALYQQSLENLRGAGRIDIVPREEAERLYPDIKWGMLPPAYRNLIVSQADDRGPLLNQVLDHLRAQSQASIPPRVVQVRAAQPGRLNDTAQFGILIPASRQLLSDAQMGFDPLHVKMVRGLGLLVTARIPNPLNLDRGRLSALLDEAQGVGAHVVVCSEEEVLGYNSMIKDVAREMRKRELLFGNIEFTKQRGWDDLSRQTEGMLVRVHSVGGDEAAKAKMEMLIDRYARAVKERNIRVAYIRLIRQAKGETEVQVTPGQQPGQPTQVTTKASALDQNLEFVGEISRELKAQPLPFKWLRPGLVMGGARGFHDYPLSVLEPVVHSQRNAKILRALNLVLSGLGAVGGTLLLLNLFFDLRPRAQVLWAIVGILLACGLGLSPGMGAKLLALQAGCVFSAIGVLWGGLPELWDDNSGEGSVRASKAPSSSVWAASWQGTVILVKTTLLTMIGPLLIIALLNYWKFFSGADKFLLPKMTQLVPLLLVGIAFAGEVFPHRVVREGASPSSKRARARLEEALGHPFTGRIALAAVALLVLGSLWIARTGNDSGMEISPIELKFRALLERIFITRPRTKEIFMGHPAMLFAVWFALRRQRLLALAAVVLATIGQADVLNTFCHIHTPIFYSLLRTIHGVWLGALFGLIGLWFWVAAEKLIGKWRGGGPSFFDSDVSNGVKLDALAERNGVDGTVNGKPRMPEPEAVAL